MGRQQFERVIAAAPREKLRNLVSSAATPMAVAAVEQVSTYAAAGTVNQVLGAYFFFPAPAGAASGSHKLYISFANPTIDQLKGETAFGQALLMSGISWSPAPTVSQNPPDAGSTATAMRGLMFDDITPMITTYVNSTNVAQANTRTYRLWTLERQVR